MQHLTEEQLVSHYYHDDESPSVDAHLRDCRDCTAQYDTVGRVLALVSEAPVPDRGDDYGDQVWSRLRWKLGSERRRRTTWISGVAAAAALTIAFFAGHFWRAAHETTTPPRSAAVHTGGVSTTVANVDHGDKILLLVVGDHLDSTERVLLEVANADPAKGLQIEQESRRAGELVAANRIYRQTAAKRGNERIASVLADLEPAAEIERAAPVDPRVSTNSSAGTPDLPRPVEPDVTAQVNAGMVAERDSEHAAVPETPEREARDVADDVVRQVVQHSDEEELHPGPRSSRNPFARLRSDADPCQWCALVHHRMVVRFLRSKNWPSG